MTAATSGKKRWTVEEYLAMEGSSLDKHEFRDGEVFAMAGASPEHNLIVSGLGHALLGAFRGKCRVYAADMRILIPSTGLYTYADTSVVCGTPDFTLDKPPALKNPEMVFEVLSESTESYDRGDKFADYRTIPSLSHYVVVAQTRILVEHFTRNPDETWTLRELRAGQSLRFPCGDVAVDALYLQVSPVPAHPAASLPRGG
jgi:Uma2 family endonuclease